MPWRGLFRGCRYALGWRGTFHFLIFGLGSMMHRFNELIYMYLPEAAQESE
jgi:hypothetical protein